ncbi:MAG: phosphatidate cytidylyltransferase [Bacteroidia bacterium]
MIDVWRAYALVLLPLFLVGAISMWFITRKRESESRSLWLKYGMYLLIVTCMTLAISMEWMYGVFSLLLVGGLVELIQAGRSRVPFALGNVVIAVFLFFVLMAALFLFVEKARPMEQMLVYLVVVIFDGFSQICGQLFGRLKLARRLSPGKTLEGAVGGFLVTLLVMYLVAGNFSDLGLVALLCVAALVGDLLASGFKRVCGVKDFGDSIPGHGGFLDRFDSFIGAVGLSVLIQFF